MGDSSVRELMLSMNGALSSILKTKNKQTKSNNNYDDSRFSASLVILILTISTKDEDPQIKFPKSGNLPVFFFKAPRIIRNSS